MEEKKKKKTKLGERAQVGPGIELQEGTRRVVLASAISSPVKFNSKRGICPSLLHQVPSTQMPCYEIFLLIFRHTFGISPPYTRVPKSDSTPS